MYSRRIGCFSKNYLYNINRFSFTTINLTSRQGVETRVISNPGLNWQLSRVWVTPQNKVHHNTLSASSSSSSNESDVITKCSPIDFERYLRKIGLVISREENVYVQDGVYNSKNVRVISSNSSDAELGFSLLSSGANGVPEAHVIILRDHADIGRSRKFMFFDEGRKILISNSSDANLIKERLEKI